MRRFWVENPELHGHLIERQPTDILARKETKAARRGFWTQEDLDLASRQTKELTKHIEDEY